MALGTPIAPLSLVDQAFEQIADAIAVGELKPGERIREAFLARKMGISRGVLREAMHRLEGRKLVARTSNIGASVVQLTEQDFYELFTLREALEALAARLAATHMTADEVAELRSLIDDHRQHDDIRHGDGYFQRPVDDFHFCLARGSKNGRLIAALCDDLYYQLRLYRYRSSNIPGRAQAALAEHQEIVDAIEKRDPDRAERAMRSHMANSQAKLTWGEARKTLQPVD